jgi:hypothetical protein
MDAAVYKDCKSLVKTPRCSEFPLCSPRYPRIPLGVTRAVAANSTFPPRQSALRHFLRVLRALRGNPRISPSRHCAVAANATFP